MVGNKLKFNFLDGRQHNSRVRTFEQARTRVKSQVLYRSVFNDQSELKIWRHIISISPQNELLARSSGPPKKCQQDEVMWIKGAENSLVLVTL